MHNIMHTDHLMKILAEEAIEVAHGAANRWTGLPFTQVFHPPPPPPPVFVSAGKCLVPVHGEL